MIELLPQLQVARLDVAELFGRNASLHVDLGCGDGSFLCEIAQQFPKTNFLGIERLTRRVEKVRGKAEKIEKGYKKRGVSSKEAEKRAWATVNKSDKGGKKSGSGRGKKSSKKSSRKGGKKGGKKSGGKKKR